MTPEVLDHLLATESPRVEWKSSDKDGDEVLQAVCALANDLEDSREAGYLVLGVNPKGVVVGLGYSVSAVDQAQQSVSNRLTSTKLLPHPSVTIHPVTRGAATLFVLEVEPYPVPPVVKVNGVAWVRQGTTKPLFDLKVADGVSGGQLQAVSKARDEFTAMTHELLRRMSAA